MPGRVRRGIEPECKDIPRAFASNTAGQPAEPGSRPPPCQAPEGTTMRKAAICASVVLVLAGRRGRSAGTARPGNGAGGRRADDSRLDRLGHDEGPPPARAHHRARRRPVHVQPRLEVDGEGAVERAAQPRRAGELRSARVLPVADARRHHLLHAGRGGQPRQRHLASPAGGQRVSAPEKLPPQVNSGRSQFNAFVAPDESYLIVPIEGRSDSIGGCDYYVVFRNPDDRWSEPINLGPA